MAAETMTQSERPGGVTFKGVPMTLVGQEMKVGDRVPDFHVQTAGTRETVDWNTLSDGGTKAVLMILVPSIDTSVCSLETEEGEAQARAFSNAHPEFAPEPIGAGESGAPEASVTPEGWLRILPHHLEGGIDGFFVARWRRNA